MKYCKNCKELTQSPILREEGNHIEMYCGICGAWMKTASKGDLLIYPLVKNNTISTTEIKNCTVEKLIYQLKKYPLDSEIFVEGDYDILVIVSQGIEIDRLEIN
jgi:uncharacterized Zn finger protein